MGQDTYYIYIDKQLCFSDTESSYSLIVTLLGLLLLLFAHLMYVSVTMSSKGTLLPTLLADQQFEFTKHRHIFSLPT